MHCVYEAEVDQHLTEQIVCFVRGNDFRMEMDSNDNHANVF